MFNPYTDVLPPSCSTPRKGAQAAVAAADTAATANGTVFLEKHVVTSEAAHTP
jgi:hypothetical protein